MIKLPILDKTTYLPVGNVGMFDIQYHQECLFKRGRLNFWPKRLFLNVKIAPHDISLVLHRRYSSVETLRLNHSITVVMLIVVLCEFHTVSSKFYLTVAGLPLYSTTVTPSAFLKPKFGACINN